MIDPGPLFVANAALDYRRYRTAFAAGARLTFDESYARAHLPLIAPDHPAIIARDDARGYVMGRHHMVYSAVLPIPADALEQSPDFQALDGALRAASFASKVDWNLLPKRRDVLHATLCGTLATDHPPTIGDAARAALRRLGPFSVELRGLFSGNVNVGRLYLPLYPEMRSGANVIHAVQTALGRAPTNLYLVGLYNFRDALTIAETAALQAILTTWQDRPLLRWACDEIWILGARDDLVLEREIAERLRLR